METLTIGRLAERGGVNLETVRYYEREGLMPPPPRNPSGHRTYSPSAVRRLRFIRRCQELGFSLYEIKELLALRSDPEQPCAEVIRQIDGKTAEVERRIAQLRTIHRALRRLQDSCEGACHVSDCPILESLDTEIA
ncbi:MAG: heavy metal-responsive transcriptional regulator [Bryobacteraceae bacterium]